MSNPINPEGMPGDLEPEDLEDVGQGVCPDCNGSGLDEDGMNCPTCEGTGEIDESEDEAY